MPRWILLAAILLMALWPASIATAQQTQGLVYVEDLQAKLETGLKVKVSGKVRNMLSWTIRDVEVIVIFQDGAQQLEATTTIDRIDPGKAGSFSVTKELRNPLLATFRAGVIDYAISSAHPLDLLAQLATTRDSLTRQGIANAFNHMPSSAQDELITCITGDRSLTPGADLLLNDVLCLNGLYVAGDGQSVEALLRLVTRYQGTSQDLGPFLQATTSQGATILDNLRLLDLVPTYGAVTTRDLVGGVLQRMGDEALPPLLYASASSDARLGDAALDLLQWLNKQNDERLLAAPDDDDRREIMIAMVAVGRIRAIFPLLEMAVDDPATQPDIDRALESMRPDIVAELLAALSHPRADVADYAERLLTEAAPNITDELAAAWASQGTDNPAPDDPQAMVAALRAHADEVVTQRSEAQYEAAWALYQAEDCTGAAAALLEMFATRTTTPHVAESAAILTCEGDRLAQAAEYDAALDLGTVLIALNPQDAEARQRMAAWHTALGDQLSEDEASAAQYRAALDYVPDAAATHRKLRDLVLAANPVYLVVGLVFLVGTLGVSIIRKP